MAFQGDSIYWVEVEKVVPNPFQPRREFDTNKLQELADSIRMYGVLQPLTVTRTEVQRDDGTFFTEYELIAGERRLRASRLAGVAQVPVIIREGEQSEQEKLELAIIENLQREDLNAVDRALAFQQLSEQFKLNHAEVARKVGRSREYVANSIRLLQLPEHIQGALQRGELGEGHARTLLMLNDRPEEQETIFREILLKKMSVREVERIVRKIATDKVRKPSVHDIDDHLIEIEKEFTETLGTRVQIQKTDFGGKLTIDYFSDEDLSGLLARVRAEVHNRHTATAPSVTVDTPPAHATEQPINVPQFVRHESPESTAHTPTPIMHTPEPVVTEPEAQPLAQAQPAPSVQTPVTPPATADPSLLSRLAAHTPLSFMSPSKDPLDAPVSDPNPSVTPTETTPQAPVVPEYRDQIVSDPTPTPQTAESVAEQSTETIEPPSPAQPAEDDEDIYSIRNFNV